jgi:hypothetical protein
VVGHDWFTKLIALSLARSGQAIYLLTPRLGNGEQLASIWLRTDQVTSHGLQAWAHSIRGEAEGYAMAKWSQITLRSWEPHLDRQLERQPHIKVEPVSRILSFFDGEHDVVMRYQHRQVDIRQIRGAWLIAADGQQSPICQLLRLSMSRPRQQSCVHPQQGYLSLGHITIMGSALAALRTPADGALWLDGLTQILNHIKSQLTTSCLVWNATYHQPALTPSPVSHR